MANADKDLRKGRRKRAANWVTSPFSCQCITFFKIMPAEVGPRSLSRSKQVKKEPQPLTGRGSKETAGGTSNA